MQSLIVLFSTIGSKKSCKMILQYPGLILTPIFSYWTFGDPKGCCKRNPENKLRVSFRLTWGNLIITSIGTIAVITDSIIMIHNARGDEEMISLGLVLFSPLILSWITFIILHNLQKCQRRCYTCLQFDQVYQKTYLDPDNPDKLIDTSKPLEHEVIEMVAQNQAIREDLQQSTLEDIRTLPKKLKNISSESL